MILLIKLLAQTIKNNAAGKNLVGTSALETIILIEMQFLVLTIIKDF